MRVGENLAKVYMSMDTMPKMSSDLILKLADIKNEMKSWFVPLVR